MFGLLVLGCYNSELGARWEVARVLSEMGRSTFALGDYAEAERLWYESLRLSQETQGTPTTIEAMVGISKVQAKCGNYTRALQLILISIPHPAAIPKTNAEAQKLASELEGKLTWEEVHSAHTLAGNMMLATVARELIETG